MAVRELIALIGPRGSGKTTVAASLARHLGWDWLDADMVLENRAGRSIREVFRDEGEAGFRSRENDILRELVTHHRHILATGGGVVLHEANRYLLRASAMVVWLRADAATLWERTRQDVSTLERRPALLGGGRDEIDAILRLREPHYRDCSHYHVVSAGREVADIAAEIAQLWHAHTAATAVEPG